MPIAYFLKIFIYRKGMVACILGRNGMLCEISVPVGRQHFRQCQFQLPSSVASGLQPWGTSSGMTGRGMTHGSRSASNSPPLIPLTVSAESNWKVTSRIALPAAPRPAPLSGGGAAGPAAARNPSPREPWQKMA